MAYCSESDVKIEFKNITWDTSGGIASATVAEWTVQESAVIDSYLSERYVIPVTGTNSLSVLKKVAILLTSHRVKMALQVKSIDPASQDQLPDDYERAIAMLNNLAKGVTILPDAPLTTTSNETLKVYYVANPPIFDKSKVQW